MRIKLLKPNLLLKIILLITLSLSLLFILKPLFFDYYPDYASYYFNVSKLKTGGNPYITSIDAYGPFLYPPPSILLFYPLSFFNYLMSAKIFTTLSLIAFFASNVLLFKKVKIKLFSTLGIFFWIMVLNYFPEKFTFGMGQVNNFVYLFLLLFVFAHLKKSKKAAGVFLGIAVAIKVTPVVLLFYLAVKNDWKTVKFTLTALLILFSASIFLWGMDFNFYYFKNVFIPHLFAMPSDYYNQSLTGFLLRLPTIFNFKLVKIFLSLALILTPTMLVLKQKEGVKPALPGINAFLILPLLISSISWQHHFVLLYIPFFLTFRYINMYVGIKSIYFLFLISSYLLVAVNLKNPSVFPVFFQSHVFYGALVLYFLNIKFLYVQTGK